MRIKLYYSEEVKDLLNDGSLSTKRLEKIVKAAEESGEKILESDTGLFIGRENASDTSYWVYYRPYEAGYEVVRADSHHMVTRKA